ncbi:hypothetical protein I7I51_02971 [Histoplasma capsulatum]|uniref:Mucin-7 n=1 Tax=Ajellomyces capsulatus TaxID=5037 RepID=A0A8A1MQ32_AJECA|nr:predicted protein [Histoplasma mississippiense (nom. inval.)]EDN11331.1 predicted protein [Histoplasma mississippiense (nom. inval.)]QSS66762.1 hypothetical protein I7I51_02971 [Histoplasma capsulatum]
MSDNRAQTGVRSLLARFENNNNNSSTSPPSRGRSPIDQDGPGSVRPLSKVRASFVAVERAGQSGSPPMWGLRKAADLDSNNTNNNNSSANNSPGKIIRTISSGVDDVGSPIERSVTMSSSNSADKGTMMSESLSSSFPDNRNKNNTNANNNNNNGGLLGSGNLNKPWAAKLPSRLMDSPTPGKQSASEDILMVAATTEGKDSGKVKSKRGPQENMQQEKEGAPIAAARMNGKSADKAATKKSKPSMNQPSRPAKIVVGNDANNATSKKTSTKELKSPLPRTPRTPTTMTNLVAKTTPKETDRPRAAVTKQPIQPAADKATTKPLSSVSTRDKIAKPSSENPPATNRSRTRSPTKPIRLPNSMAAPTASSAAKSNADGRPASQAGTRISNLTRKPSSLRSDRNNSSKSTGPIGSAAQKPAKRASSLAPQKNTAHDRPRSRVSNVGAVRAPDESFLARMMRPTASSASKMHEKVEIKSPPRGSGPPKVRRKSGESASSHVSANAPAKTPPSSKKKILANPARALSSNGDVEPLKEPEPDGTQTDTSATAAEVETDIQNPEPQPTGELEPDPDAELGPSVAGQKPVAVEPIPQPEAELVAEPEQAIPEPEPRPVSAEPIVPETAATEPTPGPLPDKADVSIIEVDPAGIPLPEPTEHVEL